MKNNKSEPKLVLVYKKDKKPVKIGDIVKDFRGDSNEVTDIEEPRHLNSSGRVYLRSAKDKDGFTQGYFPSVIDCEWVKL